MLADRMKTVEESGTVRMAQLAAELKAEGQDVISFAVGEPDFPTPAHVLEAAKAALDQGYTRYTSTYGLPELRQAIAEKSRRENSIPCEASDVMVSSAKHAIFACLMAYVDRGDEVLVPDPGWVSYVPAVRLCGGTPVPVPLDPDAGYTLRPEAVAEAITPRTKMLLLNTPSNPTGGVQDRASMQGLADLAKDHDLLVLTDELYEKILYEGEHISLASLPGLYDRTLTVNGFSKSYAMTGWRLGWLIAPPDLLEPANRVQNHTLTCATAFAQKAAVEALRGPQEPVEAMVREFRARRDLMVKGLNDVPGFQCPMPRGTFYAWPSHGGARSSGELAEFLLGEAHVAVTPGTAFGARGEGHLRFSFATSRERIKEGLERLGEAARGL
jgi:aspartate aminotransferase